MSYIPNSGAFKAKLVFIPKLCRPSYISARNFPSISLSSLKTLKRQINRFIRDGMRMKKFVDLSIHQDAKRVARPTVSLPNLQITTYLYRLDIKEVTRFQIIFGWLIGTCPCLALSTLP